jgi:CHAT domain-containing protein
MTSRDRRSAEALRAQLAYDHEIDATSTGARSHRLREDAEDLSNRGDDAGAHARYLEAASLFAHDDDSAAAAACWFDLAESYWRLTSGVRAENLLQARNLFERSFRSPVRQRTPLRLALTHDALGRVLRALAGLRFDDAEALLDDAQQHLGRACAICESLGPVGLVDGAGYRHNLGNLLMERGRWDDAERSYRLALAHAAGARRDPEQLGFMVRRLVRPFEPQLHLGLARLQLQRGRKGDLAPALRGLDVVIRDGDATMASEAHLLAARALLARAPERAHEAQQHLRTVDMRTLESHNRNVWLLTLREAGLTDLARRALRLALADALQRRSASIADHASDHGAHEAQEISRLAAGLHADEGRPVEAFLALEETAALRFFETVHAQGWQPRDPVARALAQHRVATALAAKALDVLASRIAYMADVPMRAALREIESEHEREVACHAPTPDDELTLDAERAAETVRFHRRIIEAIRRALPAPSPPAALRESARELGEESMRAHEILARRDPEADHRTSEGATALDPAGLRSLLEEHPGDVLLRVSLGTELLAVGVWIDDGSLAGGVVRRPLGSGELHALDALQRSSAPREETGPAGASISEALAMLLSVLDVDGALPNRHIEHLVVLPSTLAALIPWAAAGTAGRTLLDRADAISYLPNLSPRVTRQRTLGERSGTLLVAPGDHCYEEPTRFHDLAFSEVRDADVTLFGPTATRERVLDEAAWADVVSIYTHGRHVARDGSDLSLADGDLPLDELDHSWHGCERVELWACQSGVNVPTDWLTPTVDEAFGIDVAFHHAGVRSTIGSLWTVPALVTAHLLRHYREGLAAGRDPRRALADAQRWWRDEVIANLPQVLAATPERDVPEAIGRLLGTRPSRADLDATLGSMRANAPLALDKHSELVRDFSSPEAWAGFRFMGVVDRRPIVMTGDPLRPLTSAEHAEVDALLAATPAPPRDIDAFHRDRLAEATALDPHKLPRGEQAVMVARRYAERGLGSLRHNILRGLAWVHEALAAPGLTADVGQALALEATWLWTELARGELDAERLRPLHPVDQIVVERARTTLGACAASPEAPILEAWIDRLASKDPLDTAEVSRRWPSLRDAVRACAKHWSSLRAMALVAEWILACNDVPAALNREAVALARTLLDRRSSADAHLVACRLRSSLALLALRVDEVVPPPPPHLLSAREIARSVEWSARLDQSRPDEGVDGRAMTSAALDRLEGIHWGAVGDALADFWDSSGTPGVAWERVASGYFTSKFALTPEPRLALHHLASMQLGADLRLGALNRQKSLSIVRADVGLPAMAAWSREHLLQRLEDLARLPDLESGLGRSPSPFDAFRLGASAMTEAGARSPWALTGWDAASTVSGGDEHPPAARTCAFLIERRLRECDAAMNESWSRTRSGAEDAATRVSDAPEGGATLLLQSFAPPRRIDDLERWLREIPLDRAVLGVSIGASGELLLSFVCRTDGGLLTLPVMSTETLGWQALDALQHLLAPSPGDHTPMQGVDEARAGALDELRALLDEPLSRCFAQIPGDRPRVLSVFAPGALRAVPWWSLTAGGVPLRDRFAAVTHLPCLSFTAVPDGDGPRVLCALGDEVERGETRFGARSVSSLRAHFPGVLAAEPVDLSHGRDVVETELLDEVAQQVEVVRWYGVGTPWTVNPSTEGLTLTDGRTLSTRNLLGTVLPRCRRVEYWAATGDMATLVSTATRDRDVFPQLVWSALAAGAGGVLDLAWPVHDLVKALVCERFGVTVRCRAAPDAVALGISLREVGALLARWARESPRFDSTRAALAWLDEARRLHAVEAGLDAKHVQGFAALAGAPCVGADVGALVRVCASPFQLGAFRWWGT